MSDLNREISNHLRKDPVSVALMLSDRQIEEVIAAFVAVLLQRKTTRSAAPWSIGH